MARLSSVPAKERQDTGGDINNNKNNIKQNDNNINFLNPLLFNGMSYKSVRGGSSSSQAKQQGVQLQLQPDDSFDSQTSIWNQSSLTPGPSLGLPYNFSQIINPSFLCASRNFVIVYIHTAPNNFKRRMAIRQTWGEKTLLKNYEIRLVFVMGVVDSIRIMDMVKLESDRYNDIMQSDFKDSYRNLSFKAMVALRWIAAYCTNITYILKTDDDILVNIYLLAKQLNDLHQHNFGRQDFIMCNVWTGMRAIRDRRSKWFVPRREFPRDTYPSYCSGSAFVMSPDLAVRLLKKSLSIPFFWIDDVYVTGVLVKAIGLRHVRFNSAYVLDSGKVVDRFFKDTTRTLVFYHVRGYNTMYMLWQKLRERMNTVTPDHHRILPLNRTPGHR